jgi:hypothetical protein
MISFCIFILVVVSMFEDCSILNLSFFAIIFVFIPVFFFLSTTYFFGKFVFFSILVSKLLAHDQEYQLRRIYSIILFIMQFLA